MELTSSDSISVFDSLRRRMMMPEPWTFTEPLRTSNRWSDQMVQALKAHWPEYLMEATALGSFMISACAFTVLLYHPASPVVQGIQNEAIRRRLMGVAMGSTAVALIFSPLGKQSGGHFNPAVTLTYLRLGKIANSDALFYMLFQFVGGIIGVLSASVVLRSLLAHAAVNYAVTVPGPDGLAPAFAAELIITFILMTVI